jgi:hypothetical protein
MQTLPAAAFDAPVLLNFLQCVFQPVNPLLHATTVHFELLFARTARADAAALP